MKFPTLFMRVSLALLATVSLAACKMGPRQIAPDRFSYTEAIARSNHEQLLANLVRLRYSEPPVFLGVTSVLTQYVYSGSIGAEGVVNDNDPAFAPEWTAGASIRGTYIERPTITYSPLTGQEFAQQLLAPIDTQAVFALVESGWSPVDLMKMAVESINRLSGRIHRPKPTPAEIQDLRDFSSAVDMILELGKRDVLEMHRDSKTPDQRFLVFDNSEDPETLELIAEFKSALGLAADVSRFRVTDRDIRSPEEITIRVRSFGAMLGYGARGVEVPAPHLEKGLAIPMTGPEDDPTVGSLIRLRVLAQEEYPEDPFVAIEFKGYWFYIPRDDHESKQAFGLLGYLFQIQAPDSSGTAPVLTVPTG